MHVIYGKSQEMGMLYWLNTVLVFVIVVVLSSVCLMLPMLTMKGVYPKSVQDIQEPHLKIKSSLQATEYRL